MQTARAGTKMENLRTAELTGDWLETIEGAQQRLLEARAYADRQATIRDVMIAAALRSGVPPSSLAERLELSAQAIRDAAARGNTVLDRR